MVALLYSCGINFASFNLKENNIARKGVEFIEVKLSFVSGQQVFKPSYSGPFVIQLFAEIARLLRFLGISL